MLLRFHWYFDNTDFGLIILYLFYIFSCTSSYKRVIHCIFKSLFSRHKIYTITYQNCFLLLLYIYHFLKYAKYQSYAPLSLPISLKQRNKWYILCAVKSKIVHFLNASSLCQGILIWSKLFLAAKLKLHQMELNKQQWLYSRLLQWYSSSLKAEIFRTQYY